MARKRKGLDGISDRPKKTLKTATPKAIRTTAWAEDSPNDVHHTVLSSFYPKVCTLRRFLLDNLPSTSRVRRRKLSSFGTDDGSHILDTCLVGVVNEPSISLKSLRKVEFATFTQSQHRATGAYTGRSLQCCMSEVIDFVIWSLFKSNFKGLRPQHILCHGLQRASAPVEPPGEGHPKTSILPGVVRSHPNDNLDILKSPPWSDVLPLLGEDAELIFSSLLLDCAVFTKLSSGKGNYFQLSGVPIAELKQIPLAQPQPAHPRTTHEKHLLRPSKIRFLRNRILYARPSLNAAGKVKFGLHHTHVLQRLSDTTSQAHTVHVAKYMFPRQFRLHNVFTSKVDPLETTQLFKDYTFREQEINGHGKTASRQVPRRLRGEVLRLIQKLRRNHQGCSYSQLLRHYCPVSLARSDILSASRPQTSTPCSEHIKTQVSSSRSAREIAGSPSDDVGKDSSFLVYSTSLTNVSAFCRAVISHLLPQDAFGKGDDGLENRRRVMSRIHDFVQLRRFESMTLHKVVQGIHLQPISWLSAPGQQLGQKLAQSDYAKRLDILYEFIYYLFDSILIPLIRANFYVTESSSHRNRLFYFRHDMWRKLSEPSLATLRLNMYVALPPSRARQKLQSRALGYSHLRLLPKDQGARPITNLRRRQQKVVAGRRALGSSINAQLGSLFSVLNYERQRNPRALGSAMLSVGDIHKRLADFKRRIPPGRRLFFAKVDIKSCFDSIPQEHLLSIVQPLFSQHSYRSARHTEVKALEDILTNDKPSLKRRFVGSARPADETAVFSESRADEIASKRRKVVLADTGNYRVSSRNALYKLLQEHVGDSIVKFGNKHMRQTDGIPQGSVLSSILCSFFYGAFERQELGFLDSKACLLLRLIDDFLLITTEDQLARQFLQVMANGDPKYGIFVNADKSLANFDVAIHGQKVPRLHGSNFFPYCGMGIETNTLELRKDRDKKDTHVRNGLSVETCTRPGVTLRRRVLASLKLQMHAMLLDMSLNSRNQVISTLLGNFAESAMKMHQYIAHLGQSWRVSSTLVRRLIEELVVANTKVCWIKDGARGHISRAQMCWIASAAFEQVLLRKQSQYKEVLVWLKSLRKSTEASMNLGPRTLGELLKDNGRSFQGYVY